VLLARFALDNKSASVICQDEKEIGRRDLFHFLVFLFLLIFSYAHIENKQKKKWKKKKDLYLSFMSIYYAQKLVFVVKKKKKLVSEEEKNLQMERAHSW
jgi:hypothetical protein